MFTAYRFLVLKSFTLYGAEGNSGDRSPASSPRDDASRALIVRAVVITRLEFHDGLLAHRLQGAASEALTGRWVKNLRRMHGAALDGTMAVEVGTRRMLT